MEERFPTESKGRASRVQNIIGTSLKQGNLLININVALKYPIGVKMAGNIIHVGKDNFEKEVLKSEVPVLVDFYAIWCGPCMALAPTLEKLAGEMEGKAKIVKINVDEEPELAREFGIVSIPALFLFKNGELVSQDVGVHPLPALKKWIEQVL